MPDVALFRHAGAVRACPFIGTDRKWPNHGRNDAIDPEQKSMQTLPRKMVSRATGPLGSSFNLAADFTSSSERRTLPLAPAPWS